MTVNIARLSRLALLLETYKGDLYFDLKDWNQIRTRRVGFLWHKKENCGFAACAVGLACLSNEFAADRLEAFRFYDGTIVPKFGALVSWAAVRKFFSLTTHGAAYLFDVGSYEITEGPEAALAVAARIRTTICRSEQATAAHRRKRTKPVVDAIKAAALQPLEPVNKAYGLDPVS